MRKRLNPCFPALTSTLLLVPHTAPTLPPPCTPQTLSSIEGGAMLGLVRKLGILLSVALYSCQGMGLVGAVRACWNIGWLETISGYDVGLTCFNIIWIYTGLTLAWLCRLFAGNLGEVRPWLRAEAVTFSLLFRDILNTIQSQNYNSGRSFTALLVSNFGVIWE